MSDDYLCRVSHQKVGVTGWYLDRVRVECRDEKKTWNIPCHQWFGKDTTDAQVRDYPCKGRIMQTNCHNYKKQGSRNLKK